MAGPLIRDSGHPPSVYSLRINRAHPVVREIRVLSIWFEGHLILATKTSPYTYLG